MTGRESESRPLSQREFISRRVMTAGESEPRPLSEREFASRRLHFVGIGGVGMSGLALVAHELGASVTGSDVTTSTYLDALLDRGIEIKMGNAAENVPPGAEVVYSTVVPPDNPERRAARGRELHRAELLAQIAALRRAIAITGTHGKTTTAAMVVHALQANGLDPAYVIGGEHRTRGVYAAWGKGEWIVVEADESDRSLLHLAPEIALLTSAELDHHATYGSRLELEQTLREFMARATGAAVVWNRPALRALCPPGAIPYDAPEPLLERGRSRFAWRGLEVELQVPGAHNAINAAGALEVAVAAGADAATAARSLSSFSGVHRRLELLGETRAGAAVYDDYAHNPTKVAAAIDAVRTFGPRRVVAVFQPHRYSRTAALFRALATALARADLVVVLDVYPAREHPDDYPGVDGSLVAGAAADQASGRQVAWLPGFDEARSYLNATLRAGDLCLVMGAGNVDALGRSLVSGGEPVAGPPVSAAATS
jgi:UDP-N-acetylmuramate--alanine ligase